LFDDVSIETTELIPEINKNKEEIEENEEEKQLENQTTFNPKIEENEEISKELFFNNNQKIIEEELGKELLSSTTIGNYLINKFNLFLFTFICFNFKY